MIRLETLDIHAFQTQLLSWFQVHGRDFPWRSHSDPFAILLAEKILQQTAARPASVRCFQQLLSRYPTPHSMAHANIETLEQIFLPIGLFYRARELPVLARQIVERHDGAVPANLHELLALTGVGSYIARAVLSFAYHQDVGVVDTNVSRILYRVFAIAGPKPANPARKRLLLELSDSLVPSGASRQFNLAVLDLGGIICVNRQPKCRECPILDFCSLGKRDCLA